MVFTMYVHSAFCGMGTDIQNFTVTKLVLLGCVYCLIMGNEEL